MPLYRLWKSTTEVEEAKFAIQKAKEDEKAFPLAERKLKEALIKLGNEK